MRYVLCILALLLSCACVHVLAEEVPAADLSDQVPDTESETKILLQGTCSDGTSKVDNSSCSTNPTTKELVSGEADSGLHGKSKDTSEKAKKECATKGEKQNCKEQAEVGNLAQHDDAGEEDTEGLTVTEPKEPNEGDPGIDEQLSTPKKPEEKEPVGHVRDRAGAPAGPTGDGDIPAPAESVKPGGSDV
ncbi:uncharacterized protein TM35_000511110, partial [Trypanosoma theileri]